MAKFAGMIGFGSNVEDPEGSGIWVDRIVERPYRGDVIRNIRKVDDTTQLNTRTSVNNSISIVADAFANNHFHSIRYVRWAGALWTVGTVEVRSPRLVLSIGEVYNGPTS